MGCRADESVDIHTTEDSGALDALIIECGALIDGKSDIARGPHLISIEAGVIASIQPVSEQTPDASRLGLGYTCLPGLINTPVHFDANPKTLPIMGSMRGEAVATT